MTGKWHVVNYRNGSWRRNEVLNTKFKIGTKTEVYAKSFDISTNSVVEEHLGVNFNLKVPLQARYLEKASIQNALLELDELFSKLGINIKG
jgi:hypothetical protein